MASIFIDTHYLATRISGFRYRIRSIEESESEDDVSLMNQGSNVDYTPTTGSQMDDIDIDDHNK